MAWKGQAQPALCKMVMVTILQSLAFIKFTQVFGDKCTRIITTHQHYVWLRICKRSKLLPEADYLTDCFTHSLIFSMQKKDDTLPIMRSSTSSHLVWGGGGSCQAEPDHDNGSGQDEEAQDNASNARLSGYTCQPVRPACLCGPKGT